MLGPAGRRGWLGENLQVSLPPSLLLPPLFSVWCWAWDNTSGWAAGSIISGKVKNGASAQGRAGEPGPKPHRHYFKSCCGDSFRKRWLLCRRRHKVEGAWTFREAFQWFRCIYYKSLTHNHRIMFKNVGWVLSTVQAFCLLQNHLFMWPTS